MQHTALHITLIKHIKPAGALYAITPPPRKPRKQGLVGVFFHFLFHHVLTLPVHVQCLSVQGQGLFFISAPCLCTGNFCLCRGKVSLSKSRFARVQTILAHARARAPDRNRTLLMHGAKFLVHR